MTAAAFRAALERLGWTQEDAARHLGACNRQRVSEWARGARPVPPYVAAHLETHLRLAIVHTDRRSAMIDSNEPGPACDQCGAEFETTPEGTTHHLNTVGERDHDADADHVPYGTDERV